MIRFFFIVILKPLLLWIARTRAAHREASSIHALIHDARKQHVRISLSCCVVQTCILMVKMLLAARDLDGDGWFWGTWGASIAFIVLEIFLLARRRSNLLTNSTMSRIAINGNIDESDPLLHEVLEQQSVSQRGGRLVYTEENIKAGQVAGGKKRRKDAFLRLVRMSAPDKWLLLCGFLALTIGAVASTSLPHFTG